LADLKQIASLLGDGAGDLRQQANSIGAIEPEDRSDHASIKALRRPFRKENRTFGIFETTGRFDENSGRLAG
jgi:hypothetical protein